MKQTGVWGFRTRTGVARVVNGRLRVRHTPRGLLAGVRRTGRESWLQLLVVGGGFVGVAGPLHQAGQAIIAEQSLMAALSAAGVGSLFLFTSMLIMIASVLWAIPERTTVAVYDMTTVTVDDTELTVTYEADDGEHETTVEVRDDEALDEAVEVLQLKGAPVERN